MDIKTYEEKMNKTLDSLTNEYGTIRAGRANPHVLDKIRVDYYGTPTPLPAGRKYLCSRASRIGYPALGKKSD